MAGTRGQEGSGWGGVLWRCILHLLPLMRVSHAQDVTMDIRAICKTLSWIRSSPQGQEQEGFNITTNRTTYTAGEEIKVILTGVRPFQNFKIQARIVSQKQPLGHFTNIPEESGLITCHSAHDTIATYKPGHWSRVSITWSADHSTEIIQFFCLVEGFSGWTEISTAFIAPSVKTNKYSDERDRRKRDTHEKIETNRDSSTPSGTDPQSKVTSGTTRSPTQSPTTAQTTSAIEATTKKQGLTIFGIDGSSLFYLMTIIGAYVGMYTIFSFLLI